MRTILHSIATLVLGAFLLSSCTMKDQETPPLTGPSEFGTSLKVEILPDVLQLDGASQAIVRITAYNEVGQPKADVPFRADIVVNGQVVDFGSLSSKSARTGSNGVAQLIYTAPAVNAEDEAVVTIEISLIGDNHQNATGRTASIRLVPTGVRVPPSDLVPRFAFSPTNPSESQSVLFDASASAGTIAQYRWDFGDGRSGTGETTTHAFPGPGIYHVRLTLVDPIGRTASTTLTLTVGQGTAPVAQFTFSPANPQPGDVVFFNASASTAAAGRRIVSYEWNFGDGTTASGVTVSRQFPLARTYTVTLKVTDDIGRTHVITRDVAVTVPDEDDGGHPAH